jgi:hypothetical protein
MEFYKMGPEPAWQALCLPSQQAVIVETAIDHVSPHNYDHGCYRMPLQQQSGNGEGLQTCCGI